MTTTLITGCARGIGRALTKALLDRGDRVIGSVRGEASSLEHDRLRVISFDVRDPDAIDAAAATIDEPIDVLVNNAGVMGPTTKSTLEVETGPFADVLDVNVLGPLRVLRAFLPALRKSDAPKVVTVSSQMGSMHYPGFDYVAYRTSKAALNKAMQCAAEELATLGIASVVVHPGWVQTDMGGADAEIGPAESARGVIEVIDALTLETSGRFIDYDGRERAW